MSAVIHEKPHLSVVKDNRFAEQELQSIDSVELKKALCGINLSSSLNQILSSLLESAALTSSNESGISNSQFLHDRYSVYLGKLQDLSEVNQNVSLASRLDLKCSPEVAVFRALENAKEAILVLKWPSSLENFAKIDDFTAAVPDYRTLGADMRKLYEVGVFHEYALIGSAHRYQDQTGNYPYIVIDVWNSFKEIGERTKAKILQRIEDLEKKS